MQLVGRLALLVERDERQARALPGGEPEPLQADALGAQAIAQPRAPRVVAGAARELDVGAAAGGGHGGVRRHAADVRGERARLGERGDGPLADEIDDRLAEAQGAGPLAGGYLPRPWPPVTEETIELDEPARLPAAPAATTGVAGAGDAVPILYLHGLPTSSFDWLGPLELGGGIAVDLPGFGRSGKRGDLDYSLAGHVAFVERLLGELGIDRVRLCLHDWGAAVGLTWASEQPERVERLVVINGVPLLAGFRWRGWARAVRTPARRAGRGRRGLDARRARAVAPRVGRARADGAGVRGERDRRLRRRVAAGAAGAAAQRDAGVAGRRRERSRAHRRAGARAVGRRGPVDRSRASARATPRRSATRRSRRSRTPGTGRGSTGPSWATGSSRHLSRLTRMNAVRWACVVAALGAAAYLLLEPASADLAAQEYRAGLVREAGLGLWDNGWFAGHHTPAYSVLFPPLGALLGVRLAGALAAVAAAALFAALARQRWGERAGHGAAGCGSPPATTATLLSGRLTFMLGAAFGPRARCSRCSATGARSPRRSRRRRPSRAPSRRCSSRSPRVAWGLAAAGRRVWGAAIAAAALAPAALLGALFPEGGTEPFVASAFWPAPRRRRRCSLRPCPRASARCGSARGSTASRASRPSSSRRRSAATSRVSARSSRARSPWASCSRCANPARGVVASGRRQERSGRITPRRTLLIALLLPLAYWQAYPAVRDVAPRERRPVDAGRLPRAARALAREPAGQLPRRDPVHREPLGGGARRAADRARARLGAPARPPLRRAVLRRHADRRALPRVARRARGRVRRGARRAAGLRGARGGAARRATGLPYLRDAWRDAHWRVYAVRRPAPLAAGAGSSSKSASAIELEPDGFAIAARRRGDVLVRVRHTRWWAVTGGRACVARGPDGMTRVRVLAPGSVRVQARLGGRACRR